MYPGASVPDRPRVSFVIEEKWQRGRSACCERAYRLPAHTQHITSNFLLLGEISTISPSNSELSTLQKTHTQTSFLIETKTSFEMHLEESNGSGKTCWIPDSWKPCCLTSYALLQTTRAKTQGKRREKVIHISRAHRHADFSDKKTEMMQQITGTTLFLEVRMPLVPKMIAIKYQQLKQKT